MLPAEHQPLSAPLSGKDTRSGIYAIWMPDDPRGRVYVGQSNNIPVRIRAHRAELRRGLHHGHGSPRSDGRIRHDQFQAAYAKYGEAGFVWAVLQVEPDATARTAAEVLWVGRVPTGSCLNAAMPVTATHLAAPRTPAWVQAVTERVREFHANKGDTRAKADVERNARQFREWVGRATKAELDAAAGARLTGRSSRPQSDKDASHAQTRISLVEFHRSATPEWKAARARAIRDGRKATAASLTAAEVLARGTRASAASKRGHDTRARNRAAKLEAEAQNKKGALAGAPQG